MHQYWPATKKSASEITIQPHFTRSPLTPQPLLTSNLRAGGKYSSGQYTYKIYHLASKVPAFIRLLAPKGSLEVHEEAWNAYPYCRTVLTNPGYMKENFVICIESLHVPDGGDQHNVHELPPEKLKIREVINIDIANDPLPSADYKPETDPTKFKSAKTGRGPLIGDWKKDVKPVMTCYKLVTAEFKWFGLQPETDPTKFKSAKTGRGPLIGDWKKDVKPVMTCYKLVTAEFKWFGLQSKVENVIQKSERRLFTIFHRQVFCSMDDWHGMTMADIRAIEDRTKEELERLRREGEVRGMRADNE
ncbi:unnamed protein product [Plutella xylostella]|uniref:(diamondback moth) hypothetical protein n=1 Tax=Plutella xylostella TaxID=51655 RepID=A0A8S4DRB1_PLUXY|nr:unnamed protein product [Plutella xylostella]